ncbi:hypothetical protein GCM10023329_51760 [Streptomyces sanyensis]|uniref:Condensation domain-containing protein n=1 Tax=Streptomyces sanyensis TaxID=568869 RepID=A0ABP9BET9_9ACTN
MPGTPQRAENAPELTAAQREVLAAQRADPENTTYNVGQYLDLRGPLDAGLLQEAVRRTLTEAPGLHLRFRGGEGRVLAEHAPFAPEAWRLHRLDTSGAADPVDSAIALVRDQLACPPRLDAPTGEADAPAAPLTGMVLVRVGERRHLLVQYFHRIAVDGYGVCLLTHRIAALYRTARRGDPPPACPFAPMRLLVEAERAYAGSAAEAADRAYWARHAAEPPRAALPRPRPAPDAHRIRRRTVRVAGAGAASLEAAVRGARVTWAEAVTAALAAQLHLEDDGHEPVMRMYATARTAPGALRVPGAAVNVLPLRAPVGPGDSFRAVLARVAAEFRAARAHQLYRRPPGASGAPPSGVLLNLRPFDTSPDFGDVSARVVPLASGPVEDLSLSAVRDPGGGLRIDLDANGGAYGHEELAGLAARYAELLARLCAQPDRPLSALAAPAP